MIDFNIVLYAIIFAFLAVWQRSSGFCFFMAGFACLAGIVICTMPDDGAGTRALYLFGIAIAIAGVGLILRQNRSK
jgi:hypothetical protein